MLLLYDSIVFFYNATYLTHHQCYVPGEDQYNDNFIIVSSYGNEKLSINHLRKSLSQIGKDKQYTIIVFTILLISI